MTFSVHSTINHSGPDYTEDRTQVPMNLEQVAAYIKLTTEANPTAMSFEFILVPTPVE